MELKELILKDYIENVVRLYFIGNSVIESVQIAANKLPRDKKKEVIECLGNIILR